MSNGFSAQQPAFLSQWNFVTATGAPPLTAGGAAEPDVAEGRETECGFTRSPPTVSMHPSNWTWSRSAT